MSSEEGWSLAFFDAPVERVLPWIAGYYLATDRTFRELAWLRRWTTPRPKLRRGGQVGRAPETLLTALRANVVGYTVPIRFGPAEGAGRVTLVEGPHTFDIREPDGTRHLPVGLIAKEAGADFYRMGWRPDLMTLMVSRAEGRPRHLTVWREAGRWRRHETGRPLGFEEPGAFGGPMAGAPFTDEILRRYLGKIAPGLEPGAGILAEEAYVIGGGLRGRGLGRFRAEAERLRQGKGLGVAAY